MAAQACQETDHSALFLIIKWQCLTSPREDRTRLLSYTESQYLTLSSCISRPWAHAMHLEGSGITDGLLGHVIIHRSEVTFFLTSVCDGNKHAQTWEKPESYNNGKNEHGNPEELQLCHFNFLKKTVFFQTIGNKNTDFSFNLKWEKN